MVHDSTSLTLGIVALGGAIAVVAALVLVPRSARGGVAQSLATIERLSLGDASATAADVSFVDRVLRPALGTLRRLAVRISPSGTPARLQRLLDKAGNPGTWTVERLLAYKGLAMLALGAIGLLLGAGRGISMPLLAIVFAAAGFWLPDLLVYNAGLKRQQSVQRDLPDTLDMLTVSVEAGLGFDAALAQVAAKSEGPLAGEFRRALQEMQIGKSRVEALRALGARSTVIDLKTFVGAVVQADTLGIPIANVLREQAREMRLKRHQRAEEQARKVPVKIMFPLVICILPALFVVVIGPGAISIMHNLHFGG
jgi:tight adherence protein C